MCPALFIVPCPPPSHAQPRRLPRRLLRCAAAPDSPPPPSLPPTAAREQLHVALSSDSTKTRTGRDAELAPLISILESSSVALSLSSEPRVLGVWRNAHTTRPKTSSLVQRTVVSSSFAPHIEQLILGPNASLQSTPPCSIITRVDLLDLFGAILNVRARVEKVDDNMLYVLFTRAWFRVDRLPKWLGGLALPVVLHVPYPVPFRLLGDKARGWQKITYLDQHLRITRGNRGSTFLLQRLSDSHALPLTQDLIDVCTSDL